VGEKFVHSSANHPAGGTQHHQFNLYLIGMSLIQLHHIHFTYPSGFEALNDVHFDLQKGEKLALMGANGSGKSSLLLLLAGVLKPQSGEYRIEGEQFRYCRKWRNKLCRQIGYVFQDPDVQVVSTHVKEDVAFGLRNMGLKELEVNQRVDQYLELCGIADLKERAIHTLSYGQKKQVALAGVLAMEPQVIMLDEPFAWLDYRQSQRLHKVLNQLADQGKTLIISTHSSDFASRWADRIMVMKEGQLRFNGHPEALFSDDQVVDRLDIAPLMVEGEKVV
jgi:cobalt/nickel transport system ATP-binding protein